MSYDALLTKLNCVVTGRYSGSLYLSIHLFYIIIGFFTIKAFSF